MTWRPAGPDVSFEDVHYAVAEAANQDRKRHSSHAPQAPEGICEDIRKWF